MSQTAPLQVEEPEPDTVSQPGLQMCVQTWPQAAPEQMLPPMTVAPDAARMGHALAAKTEISATFRKLSLVRMCMLA